MAFHEGLAFLAQVAVFIVFGLLVFPTELRDVALAGLALAILLDYCGNPDFAVRLHQDFKFAVIARLPQNEDWTLTGGQIEHAVKQILVMARK